MTCRSERWSSPGSGGRVDASCTDQACVRGEARQVALLPSYRPSSFLSFLAIAHRLAIITSTFPSPVSSPQHLVSHGHVPPR